MRQHLIGLAIVVAAHGASADTKDPLKPKPIDVKPMLDKLDVYKDDTGMYFVELRESTGKDDEGEWVFWGDGKTMYQQRIVGHGVHDGMHEWNLWSPRVRGINTANVTVKAGKLTIECKVHDPGKALTQLPADQAKTVLARAKFMPPLWTRQTHTFARDEDGVYYFVDELRDEYGGKGYRVFAGQKGAMKELPMTNVVSDSAGEIFATKTGELKIVTSDDGKAYWKQGGKKTELIKLEPQDNRYVIYRELGIYGQLGVVCDDQ
jgi:hypothetical protein